MKRIQTLKEKQKGKRSQQLISFRRYLALEGNGDAVVEFLDMNAFELREYIESQWKDGMSWDNYRSFWVVDHIVPLAYFDPFNYKEMFLCWNYTNLKPNYFMDNHAKGYCVEVTMNVLDGMKQSPMVVGLKNWASKYETMFQKYYQTA